MSDAIEVKGLRVLGVHGVLAEESERAQPFEIDLRIETDFARSVVTDELGETVDYSRVVEEVTQIVATKHFQLLESLAEALAGAVLADARVQRVTVAVRKLRPPLAADVASVGVSIVRSQSL